MQPHTYDEHMRPGSPEDKPWDNATLNRYLSALNATADVTPEEAAGIRSNYDQGPSLRAYHGPEHGGFVGQPEIPEPLKERLTVFTPEEAEAIAAVAGLFHDVGYKHIDAIDAEGTRAWPDDLKKRIGELAEYTVQQHEGKQTYRTHLTEVGSNDAVTQMVARVFELTNDGIIHNQGGNEFDSALAAAKFLESKNAEPRFIMAVTAAIAATVPFKPAIEIDAEGNKTDGHMGHLAEQVKAASLPMGDTDYQPTWAEVNDIMFLSVHIANRDIAPFIQQERPSDVIDGGRDIRKEELKEFRQDEDTLRALARTANVNQSASFLYQSLAGGNTIVPAANVPHLYIPRDEHGTRLGIEHAYPPEEVYEAAVENTQKNTEMASKFYAAHEIGILVAVCAGTLVGEPDALVTTVVNADQWKYELPASEIAKLSSDDLKVYKELMHGENQKAVSEIVHRRSPIAGTIFGVLHGEGIRELSQYVQQVRTEAKSRGDLDPFSNNPVIAQQYLDKIASAVGQETYARIVNELHSVAKTPTRDSQDSDPERAARLARL